MAQTLVSAWLWLPSLHFLAVCPWENFVVQSLTCVQHARLHCLSLSPGFCSNSCPLNQWYHSTICWPLLLCLQSFPASESFPMSWLFASGDQSIGASASASVLPMNIQDWFLLGLTGLMSLQSKGLLRVFSSTTFQKPQFKKSVLDHGVWSF